ncbi:hypothetical protein [Roseibacillus persicicus]|uniref:putative polyvalent protein kinase domain-containing protein n=1 Tax=Roseibacillus persicicus TaxID=454148 RepID=UPI0028106B0A|nr:hypothetical protein [Roseibacillus persicicus]MDQ8189180.1 hypothetical protein [Roseibacillus persicicus]
MARLRRRLRPQCAERAPRPCALIPDFDIFGAYATIGFVNSLNYSSNALPNRPRITYHGSQDPRLHEEARGLGFLQACLERGSNESDFALQQRAEEECLRLFASQCGWKIDPKAFSEKIAIWDSVGGGNEHDVFLDEDCKRVIKISKNPPNYGAQGSVAAYLSNLDNQNLIFGDSILFEGILPTNSGDVIVTSQPFIHGCPAKESTIEDFFKCQGFAPLGHFSYIREMPEFSIQVFDARPDNVFQEAESKTIVPIDVQIIFKRKA